MSTFQQNTANQNSGGTGYVMLLMDGLKLLIPQNQISAMEMTKDMIVSEDNDLLSGHIQFNNQSWPIFSFDSSLSLLTSASLNRRFCVLLETDRVSFGLMSEQAILLDSDTIRSHPVPEAMVTDGSPISALTIYADEVVCISAAENLAKILPLDVIDKNTGPR